jgi:hypothetical protein
MSRARTVQDDIFWIRMEQTGPVTTFCGEHDTFQPRYMAILPSGDLPYRVRSQVGLGVGNWGVFRPMTDAIRVVLRWQR